MQMVKDKKMNPLRPWKDGVSSLRKTASFLPASSSPMEGRGIRRGEIKKVFIETSVFIRFLTKDDEEKYKNCYNLFEKLELGKIKPYTSNIVLLEIIFILTRIYKFSKNEVLKAIKQLLGMRNLVLVEKTDSPRALDIFGKNNIKYGDCLITSQVPTGVFLITYDNHFARVLPKVAFSPDKI